MGTAQAPVYEFDQISLVALAKSPGPEAEPAQLRLLEAFEPLFRAVIASARRYGLLRTREQREDAEQCAKLGFLEALMRYDEHRGVTIGAYARPFVIGSVFRTLKGDAQLWKYADSLPSDSPASDNEHIKKLDTALTLPADTSLEDTQVQGELVKFVKSVPPRQQQVIHEIFWKDRPQADVARELGVSRMAVHDLLRRVSVRGRRVLCSVHQAMSTA